MATERIIPVIGPAARRSARRRRLLGAIAAVMVAAAAAYHLSAAMAPKADLYWFSLIGYGWFEPQTLAAGADTAAATIEPAERARRGIAVWNYPLAAVVSYALATSPVPMLWLLGLTVALVAAAAFAVALWGALREPPFVIAAAFFALLGFLPGPVPTDLLFRAGFWENLFNYLAILGNSGEVFSPLSVWPRNAMLLLFMAACARSWAGRSPWPMVWAIVPFHVLGAVAAAGLMTAAKLAPRVLRWAETSPAREAAIIIAVALAGVLAFALAHLSAHFLAWPPQSILYEAVAARLTVFAKVTAVLFLCHWGYGWLTARLQADDLLKASLAVIGVVAAMTAYGAAGSWWWHAKTIARSFAAPETSAHYDATAAYYRAVPVKARGQR